MHDVLAGFRLRTRVRTLARRSGPDATGSLGDMRVSKKPKSDSNDWTGRITFDDRGSASWELRTETGTFSREIDTVRVKAFQDAADVKLSETPPSGTDPYSTANRPGTDDKKHSAERWTT